jgi:pimeloyl-ACP methyl ester carboxylesterase
VVNSLIAVIKMENAAAPGRHIVLYGHSGGATLALLAIRDGLEVAGVVTVGGNLDPDAWAAFHGYTPLSGSLNPAQMAAPNQQPAIRHYVGENDQATPVTLVRAAARRVGGEVIVVAGFDHQCCWERLWARAVEFPRLR